MPESPVPPPEDRCPRCGGGFHCGADGPAPCACTSLKLSDALLARLRQRYTGCLCLRCLAELSASDAMPPSAATSTAPSRAP